MSTAPSAGKRPEMALQLRFGKKMHLPTEVELRFCGRDNFLFLAGGSQSDYDQYYASVINDSYHQESRPEPSVHRLPNCRLIA